MENPFHLECGTEILDIDEETHDAIVEKSKGVRESIKSKVDPKVYDSYIR